MIRIGIVGCGGILAAHLRGFRLMKEAGFQEFRVTALCARRPRDAEACLERGRGPEQRAPSSRLAGDPLSIGGEYLSDFQDAGGTAVYEDYRLMIERAPIDAVLDLTSHAEHHRVALEAFRRGKHVLTQKPMAATLRAAERMCEAAEEAGVTFGVFECFRYSAATRALEWLFRRGPGGRLQMILLGCVGAWWAPDLVAAGTPWRHRRSEGGGITLDLGVHFLHQMRYVAGRPVWVSGETFRIEPRRRFEGADGDEAVECDADDTVFASVGFAGGTVANWSASWAGRAAPTFMGTGSVYYGERARVDGTSLRVEGCDEEDLVARYRREADGEEALRRFPRGLDDWFALGQLDWLEAILEGRSPEVSGREGLLDLACALAILESSTVGRRVHLEEVLSGELREYQSPLDAALGFEG
jgi:predicted dehydrogenase